MCAALVWNATRSDVPAADLASRSAAPHAVRRRLRRRRADSGWARLVTDFLGPHVGGLSATSRGGGRGARRAVFGNTGPDDLRPEFVGA